MKLRSEASSGGVYVDDERKMIWKKEVLIYFKA